MGALDLYTAKAACPRCREMFLLGGQIKFFAPDFADLHGSPPLREEAGATPMRVNPTNLRDFPGRSGVPTEIAYMRLMSTDPAEPGGSAFS